MRVPQLPTGMMFQSAASANDGLIAGLNQLFGGFSTAISAAKKRKFAFADNEQGRTLGSFLSILTGGTPQNPVTAVTPNGIQRLTMPVAQPTTQPATPSYSLPPPNK